MRTDVKLGVVVSMVVVLVAGGYFLFRGKSETPIPIADGSSSTAAKNAAKPPAVKQPPMNAGRQVSSSKDAASRPGLPSNQGSRDATKLVTKPADRPAPAPPRERSPVTQPVSGPIAAAPPAALTKPAPAEPKAEAPMPPPLAMSAMAERAADPSPVTPPVLAVPSPAPTGTLDSTFTSRTLMAGSEPPKPTPTTPAESPTLGSPTPASAAVASKPQPSGSPPEPKVEPPKAAVDTHRVQPGDSLASLAQAYYGNTKYAKFLADSNPTITDPAKLALGSTVRVPPLPSDIDTKLGNAASAKTTTPATTTVAGGKRTYKVKAGDSFYLIAKDQLGNAARWKELLALNKTLVHGDPTALQPGQTLVLPDS